VDAGCGGMIRRAHVCNTAEPAAAAAFGPASAAAAFASASAAAAFASASAAAAFGPVSAAAVAFGPAVAAAFGPVAFGPAVAAAFGPVVAAAFGSWATEIHPLAPGPAAAALPPQSFLGPAWHQEATETRGRPPAQPCHSCLECWGSIQQSSCHKCMFRADTLG